MLVRIIHTTATDNIMRHWGMKPDITSHSVVNPTVQLHNEGAVQIPCLHYPVL